MFALRLGNSHTPPLKLPYSRGVFRLDTLAICEEFGIVVLDSREEVPMGKVYAWKDIESGRIPHRRSFGVVVRQIRKVFEQEVSIEAALVCGSVVRDDHTRRSDLDVVVVYNAAFEQRAMKLLQQLTAFAKQRYVPLEFNPCDSRTIQTRFHDFGPAFRSHLAASAVRGGIIAENPIPMFNTDGDDMAAEVDSYIRKQLLRLEKGLTKYPSMTLEQKCTFLQKALEAPTHIARKVLHRIDAMPKTGDSKWAIVDAYAEVMPQDLAAHCRKLVNDDAWYTDKLLRQLRRPDREEYEETWEVLEQFPYDVLRFVRDNIVYVEKFAARA